MTVWVFLVALLVAVASKASASMEIEYTEDIDKFKQDNQRGRMELLMGCWLYSRDHSASTHLPYRMALIKSCMKRVSRKDSVNKITSLIGKNLTEPKQYKEIVPEEHIPQPGQYDMLPGSELGEFDSFLYSYIQSYEKDIAGIQGGMEGEELKKQVEEELKKRQHYYFGVIPANKFTHTIFLVTIAVLLVLCCTCWKYWQRKGEKKEEKGEKGNQKFFKKSSFTKGRKKA